MNRWLIVFLALLIFGGGWMWWSRPAAVPTGNAEGGAAMPAAFSDGQLIAAEGAAYPAVGRMAPGFRLPTLDGGSFQLSDQRGKPVVLNFWATWCGPCRNELPAIQNAAEHLGDQVVFAAVDQDEAADLVQSFVDEMGLTFTVPMDDGGEVGLVYNVRGLPTTFFIDRNGVIQSLWMGEMNSVTLAENIAKIE